MKNWEKNIRKVVPYTPGEQPNQPDMIKLNTNENPYPPSPAVTEALKNLSTEELRLYPDPAAEMLVQAIADNYGLDKTQVFVGVGSDDVLAMSFLTLPFLTVISLFFFRILPILFMMYGQICSVFHMRDRHWMNISISEKKIISEKTVVLFSRTPMHLPVWRCLFLR